jgi:predicted RND superfamily exporter protein
VPVWIPVVLFVVIIGISAVGFIAVDVTRDEIVRQDKKIVKDVSYMRNIQSKVNSLASQCNNEDVRTEVKKLSEELKYSDPVSNPTLKEIERELYFYIEELQKAVVDEDNNAIEICKKATSILVERNRLCKLNKNNI